MNRSLFQVVATIAFSTVAAFAHAAPQKVEQLPRVVITGKSTPATMQVVQLPRVVIEGRSVGNAPQLAANTASTKPARRS